MILGGDRRKAYTDDERNYPEFHPMPENSLPNCLMGSKADIPITITPRESGFYNWNPILIMDPGEGKVLIPFYLQ